MPYFAQYIGKDIFLEYKNAIIYRAYKDGEYDNPLDYWFSMSSEDDGDEFDVRKLEVANKYGNVEHADYKTTVSILKDAIDNGEIKNK